MNKGGTQTVAGVEFRMVHAVHSSGTSGAGARAQSTRPIRAVSC